MKCYDQKNNLEMAITSEYNFDIYGKTIVSHHTYNKSKNTKTMKKLIYVAIALAIFIISCMGGGKNKEKASYKIEDSTRKADQEAKNEADSLSAGSSGVLSKQEKAKATNEQQNPNVVSSSAAVQSKKDTLRKFVRTADLKFKVKNVYQSTIEIENITAKNDGFVTYTNLSSTIDNVTTTPVSTDSSVETTYFTVINNIILRVPNYNLDSTIRGMAHLITYLDFRIIKANDVSLTLAANNMAQHRINNTTQKLNNIADKKNLPVGELSNVQQNIEDKQAQLDQVKYDKMKLMDEVKFSTVNINIYQRQTLKREMVCNEKSIKPFEPSFGTKLVDALVFSWEILLAIFLFFVRIWFILLIILVGIIVCRRFFRRKPKA